jgi:hypothetical protein
MIANTDIKDIITDIPIKYLQYVNDFILHVKYYLNISMLLHYIIKQNSYCLLFLCILSLRAYYGAMVLSYLKMSNIAPSPGKAALKKENLRNNFQLQDIMHCQSSNIKNTNVMDEKSILHFQ